MVKDKLLKLMQEINSVGSSFPMLYVKLDFVEKMELEEEQNPTFKEALTQIDYLANKAIKNIEDYNSLIEIKNIYSEAYILSKLQSLLNIAKIPERDSKTPDYKVRFRGGDIYIELKSLNMLGGTLKHREIMHDSLDSKIAAENQINKGARVGFSEQEVQPYLSHNKKYDPRSTRLVIEALIDKINQNIKEEQYSLGDTILLIDLSDQLPLISKPSEAIQETYYDECGKNQVSGELWNVAFGKLDDQIFKPADFEGADNFDGNIEKEGILISHPYIKGLIFHASEDFYSVAELTENNLNITNCLEYISKKHAFKTKYNNALQGTTDSMAQAHRNMRTGQ